MINGAQGRPDLFLLPYPPVPAVGCANRSGRLVEYLGPEDGELTIVYNDGGSITATERTDVHPAKGCRRRSCRVCCRRCYATSM